jgi:phosphonate transport system ATP-binding protein
MPIIKATNLGKTYPNGKAALKNVNIEIGKGEMVGILGLSGSGKTTFFRLLNGAISPTTGQLSLFGRSLQGISHKVLRELRNKMALVYQHHNIVPGLSVARNVFIGYLRYLPLLSQIRSLFYLKAEEVEKIARVLHSLGIGDKIFQRATDLSGGQQQRVALARILIAEPELIFADEPIASVDARTAQLILGLFKKLNEESQTTILMNLHQVDVALDYCTRVLVFNHGNLIYDGPPDQVPVDEIYDTDIRDGQGGRGCA